MYESITGKKLSGRLQFWFFQQKTINYQLHDK